MHGQGEDTKLNKVINTRDKILAFNPKRPGEWIISVQKLFKTHGLVLVEDREEDEMYKLEVTTKLRERLDAAVTLGAKKALTVDKKVRLAENHKSYDHPTTGKIYSIVDRKIGHVTGINAVSGQNQDGKEQVDGGLCHKH